MSWLKKFNSELEDTDAQEICAYGIEITLSTLVNYLLILLIGIVLHSVVSAIVFGIEFTIIRLYIGGYHCTSYLRCNITFCIIFILVMFFSRLLLQWMQISILLLILLWCGLGIWYLGPVQNSHKPMTNEQLKRCHRIAKAIYLADACLAILCYYWLPYYGVVATLSLLAVVALLPIGTLTERRRKHETEKEDR